MIHISNINALQSLYHAYLHSISKYGITSWGNSSNIGKIFILQKKINRIMAGAQPRTCCRSLFKQSETLLLLCQYILSLMTFIIKNHEIFQTNSSIYNINIWNKHHLHRTNANPSCCQKYILCWHKIFQLFNTSCNNLQEWQSKI